MEFVRIGKLLDLRLSFQQMLTVVTAQCLVMDCASYVHKRMGNALALLVETLRYNPESRRFESR
jgi:hypothetical protein